ncbi:MAG: SPOR domain-containing protein, partial [Myxococcota bacterium]
FDELDAPAEPHRRRKLQSPDWNANNEGLDYSRFRGKRPRYRQLARIKRPRRSGDRRVLARTSSPGNTRSKAPNVIAAVPEGRVLEREAPAAQKAPAEGRRVLGRTDTANQEQTASSRYVLQAGAFADKGEADQILAQLKSKGLPARMVSASVPGRGRVHRIYIGRYTSMDEARAVQGRVGRRTIIRTL